MVKIIFLINICLFLSGSISDAIRPKAEITGLRCESAINPIGIDLSRPCFSWITESLKRGKSQSACQVIVAGNRSDIESDKGTMLNGLMT
jgi:hypothetical protein